jgi:hypothetical protein
VRRTLPSGLLLLPVLVVAPLAPPLAAGEGAILLNQAIAIAGLGPGDPPGFPIELEQPGLYRLVGNLDQSGQTADLAAISILADDVTLDLNGFAVLGACPSGGCNGVASVISGAAAARARVANGHLAYAPATAVWLGDDARIENVGIFRSGAAALICGASCTVEDSLLVRNGGGGAVGAGSRVARTISDDNVLDGLFTNAAPTTFHEVVMQGNGRHGIWFLAGGGTVVGSALAGNNGGSGNPQFLGSAVLPGESLCGVDTACP